MSTVSEVPAIDVHGHFGQYVDPATHPEQGPIWAWMSNNADQVYGRFDENYDKSGPGLLRKISPGALGELDRIFEVTGCKDFWKKIETE